MKYTNDLPVYEEDDFCSLDEYSELMAQKVHQKVELLQQENTKLKEENGKIKNALINIETEQSKAINIEDASKLPAKLEILGNHEQDGEASPINPVPVVCVGSNADGTFKGSTEIKTSNETQQESKTLNIQQEMLQGDYFVKESDGWKEVHTWGKIIFNGTEGWYVQNSEDPSIFQLTLSSSYNLSQATKEGSAFCNYFKQIQNEQLLKTQDGMFIIYQVTTSYIRINNSNITNVEDFKSWLQQKNSEGKPVYIFYKTITPTKLACTEEQTAVLEELNNLELFEGVNNIITTEDIALLKLNYIADTKTYVDNKYNQLANQIQQVGKKL